MTAPFNRSEQKSRSRPAVFLRNGRGAGGLFCTVMGSKAKPCPFSGLAEFGLVGCGGGGLISPASIRLCGRVCLTTNWASARLEPSRGHTGVGPSLPRERTRQAVSRGWTAGRRSAIPRYHTWWSSRAGTSWRLAAFSCSRIQPGSG